MRKIIFLITLLLISLPAIAQGESLIPCGGPDCPCTLCHFFLMIERIVRYALFTIVPILAVLMIVVGGVMMFSAYAGQSGMERVSQAKKLFTAIVIGLIIVYGAWLLINIFLSVLGVAQWTGLKTWWRVDCDVECTSGGGGGGGDDFGVGFCGDGIIQSPNGVGLNEICDGANLGGHTCQSDFGKQGGPLICSVCVFLDDSNCVDVAPSSD